ncbi:hypothetical protein [Streptomyces sp. NRRL WC-3742]|uniref:hypothetical protein n=1 Tax=Streptomyces sp. NRRL WC-3742 TaxID=1463934 RepID=UPI0004CA158B|nr:hypothetical protein [Streptomyces sp. NRRL WC-3742]
MTDSSWFNSDLDLVPGRELFRSERRFHLRAHSASHGQLLLRTLDEYDGPGEARTTIEMLFKPVAVMKLRDNHRGLAVRCATEAESAEIRAGHPSVRFGKDERVFVLESQGELDYIVAMAFGWTEGVLDHLQPSFYHTFQPYKPIRWPVQPLDGVESGLEIASAEELVEALTAGQAGDVTRVRRERHRHVFVIMTRVVRDESREVSGVSVFLTRADAEEALTAITARSVECWIEELPIAV